MKSEERVSEIATLLSVTDRSVREWTKDVRAAEKKEQQDKAWDMWLDCYSYREIGKQLDVDDKTVAAWCAEFWKKFQNSAHPDSRQHFDVWNFAKAKGDSTYFGQRCPRKS